MTQSHSLELAAFKDAADMGNSVEGGQVFDRAGLPASVAKFSLGSHESSVGETSAHMLILLARSAGHLASEIGGRRHSGPTSNDMIIYAPVGASQKYALDGYTHNLVVSVDDGFLSSLAEGWEPSFSLGKLEPIVGFKSARMTHLALDMYRTFAGQHPGWKIVAEALTMQIGAELFQSFSTSPKSTKAPSLSDADIEAISMFIPAYLDADIGLFDLASVVDMDIYAFSRAFKKKVGVTPGRFLINKRIEHARRLLSDTDDSIAEVALACGFSNQPHLTNTFSKHVGASPGRYRRETRE